VSADPAVPDRCRSVRQLAAYWRTSPARVRAMVRGGLLRAFVVGKAVRIPPEAIVEAERLLAATPATVRPKRTRSGISPAVAKLLEL
jgi:hypothetical protein